MDNSIFPMSNLSLLCNLVVIQIGISCMVNTISYRKLAKIYHIFRTRDFEDNGMFWQKVFKVKAWKEYVPAAGVFDKKNIQGIRLTDEFVSQYLLENLRAELFHSITFILSLSLILIPDGQPRLLALPYSFLLNIPCIIIQRYNRPRFERLIKNKDKKGNIIISEFWKTGEFETSSSGFQEHKEMRRQAKEGNKPKFQF